MNAKKVFEVVKNVDFLMILLISYLIYVFTLGSPSVFHKYALIMILLLEVIDRVRHLRNSMWSN